MWYGMLAIRPVNFSTLQMRDYTLGNLITFEISLAWLIILVTRCVKVGYCRVPTFRGTNISWISRAKGFVEIYFTDRYTMYAILYYYSEKMFCELNFQGRRQIREKHEKCGKTDRHSCTQHLLLCIYIIIVMIEILYDNTECIANN